MYQHVRRIDADAHDASEETNHCIAIFPEGLAPTVAHALPQPVIWPMTKRSRAISRRSSRSVFGGRGTPLRRLQRLETFRRFAQRRLEVANTEAYQTALHPVHNARALTDEPLALTARALGILLN
jgi:hypothetical protein